MINATKKGNKENMNYIKKYTQETIGKKTAILRHTMGYTQVEFADAILMARGSLAKLEKAESNNQIGLDILLRIFYAMVRLSTNTDVAYIKSLSEEIIADIICTIEKPDTN